MGQSDNKQLDEKIISDALSAFKAESMDNLVQLFLQKHFKKTGV